MIANRATQITIAGPKGKVAANAVIRQARDRAGLVLGHIAAKHDGTPAGMIAAARHVSDEMFIAFDDASNINSTILATDETGAVRWTISPNFRFIEEVGPVR